jgi:hypothetical protein
VSRSRSRGGAVPPGRKKWVPKQQRLTEIVAVVVAGIEGITAAEATGHVQAVTAGEAQLSWLHWHLKAKPDALSSGDSAAPRALFRLIAELRAAGYTNVQLPRCHDCGRGFAHLPVTVDGGRICQRCGEARRAEPCCRCGEIRPAEARGPDGPVCGRCRQRDPANWQPCAQCGKPARTARRLPDGGSLGACCYQAPKRTCVRCGELKRVYAERPDGPTCGACRDREPRPCDGCGQLRSVTRPRGGAHGTARLLCRGCREHQRLGECEDCGETRRLELRRDKGDRRLCRRCAGKDTCSGCGQYDRITAHWPIGKVCASCYRRERRNPGPCARCGDTRTLIGLAADGQRICAPCAGEDYDYACRRCGHEDFLLAEKLCPGCLAYVRTERLLTGADGTVRPQLVPLLDALGNAASPSATLQYIDPRKSAPACELLRELATTPDDIDHDLLDRLPQTLALHRVRQTLMHLQILPPRNDFLERLVPWLDNLLADQPSHRAQPIRAYAHWTLLRRARHRDAHQRPFTSRAAGAARTSLRASLRLLVWIDEQNLTLADLTQADVDHWIVTHPTETAYPARQFLSWARQRRLVPDVHIPKKQPRTVNTTIADDERWTHLRRCLHDPDLPVDVRAAGVLVLLFGLPVSRVSTLTADNIEQNGELTWLGIGRQKLLLPPAVAALIHTQLQTASSVSAVQRTVPTGPRYLFPGGYPGRSSADIVARGLRRHGMPHARHARSAALITLANKLPPPILADLLDLHINTAVQWARISQPDWSDYLAARADALPNEPEE